MGDLLRSFILNPYVIGLSLLVSIITAIVYLRNSVKFMVDLASSLLSKTKYRKHKSTAKRANIISASIVDDTFFMAEIVIRILRFILVSINIYLLSIILQDARQSTVNYAAIFEFTVRFLIGILAIVIAIMFTEAIIISRTVRERRKQQLIETLPDLFDGKDW